MKKNNMQIFLYKNSIFFTKGALYITKRTNRYIYTELHWHDYIEIEFIVKGGARQVLNGKEYLQKPGQLSILRPTDFHSCSVSDDIEYYNVGITENYFKPEFLSAISSYPNNILVEFKHDEIPLIANLFELLYNEYTSINQTDNDDIMKSIFEALIRIILRNLNISMENQEKSPIPIQKAINFLNMHFIDNPSLETTAKIAHYHPNHFSSYFHNQLGLRYSDYLNNLKVNYAKELLLSTNLNNSVIYTKCGFTSISNFIRVFKNSIGVSPVQFRKNAKLKKGDDSF